MEEIKYYKPKTLQEAQQLLIEIKEGTRILNGGTFVVGEVKGSPNPPKALIDIKGIESLKTLTFSKEKGLYIGATMTLSEIAHHKDVVENYKVLADALESVGSGQIRNRVTLVGNNCTVFPNADTSGVLLTLEAVFEVYSHGEMIEIPIQEFFKECRKNALSYSDIVIGIKIPYYKNIEGIFSKISRRKSFDTAIINSVVVKIEDKYRIALGGVAPIPIRVHRVEAYLNSTSIDQEACQIAGEMAMGECSPVDDIKASKTYRLSMVRVTVKRALIELNNLEDNYNV